MDSAVRNANAFWLGTAQPCFNSRTDLTSVPSARFSARVAARVMPKVGTYCECFLAVCIQYIYYGGMRFQYDPAKAAANWRKHGVSFADAAGVLEDPLAMTIEDPNAFGEQRFVTVGLGNAGELLVLVWTERGGECRAISARRPTAKERKQYES